MNTKWRSAFVALIATMLVASTALAAEPEKKQAPAGLPAGNLRHHPHGSGGGVGYTGRPGTGHVRPHCGSRRGRSA